MMRQHDLGPGQNDLRRPMRGAALIASVVATVIASVGCQPPKTRFVLINHPADGPAERLHETFDECFYAVGPDGNIDLVARRRAPDGVDEALSQIVHVRTFFRAEAGRGHLDRTMINGLVTYAIIGGAGGVCLEGGGFLYCRENERKGMLNGDLELATLRLNRRAGSGPDIFTRAELAGGFCARRDKQKVVMILNELDRVFGPQPDYQPSPAQAEVL